MDINEKAPGPSGRRPARRRDGGGQVLVLYLAIAVVVAVLAWPWLAPRLGSFPGSLLSWIGDGGSVGAPRPATLDERMDMVEAALAPLAMRIAEADRRLAMLEANPRTAGEDPRKEAAGVSADPEQMSWMAAEIATLKGDLEIVRKLAADEGGATKLSGAVEKAEAAFRRIAERRDRAPLFLAALGQLREAVDRGSPYPAQMKAAMILAEKGTADKLAPLVMGSATGIVTRVGLAESFRVTAAAARKLDVPADSGWVPPNIRRWLGGAVLIRRTEGGEEGLDGILNSTSRLLAGGDLAGAAALLRRAEGPSLAAIQPWLEAAELRLSADAALSELSAMAMTVASSRDE
ncbi:conserved protein of unknown function [Magnetospirillum gryphiswaldense MSR-1 v2]|uniref:Probable magnetosome protein Mms36 n=2 Tax=Magnetospirillum gryphiswaldense TaxID=55518 RepID=MMS36_MAGGM|nr:RecName: Full=Probable magnetosome protein Mms36 [Magnetospirillum gryphiswaldense MSR-1]AVM76733.1 magnetosome mebrane specific protein 36 [Magnetospirillum gryphiswaldense]CDK99613.1 conserved protein of unknown function [Magnetospirillum gryphiswaldense MSR-1 v2]CAE12015.1 conserved hypothetical protein [Magnetospirillum gryphiswaldense]CAJ30094.1 hypothetical protein mgI458 [Magnetospirillum gryphiswaldense MSR-1]CAM78003.1 conserved hypothetical protein [Magnetospirillum gryphiswaldens